MARSRKTAIITATATLALGLTGMAQAQGLQAQRATPRQANGSDLVQCAETFLHFTSRGLALECMNAQGITEYMFAVLEGQFPGRSEMVAEVVQTANERGAAGTGRTRTRQGLYIAHQAPGMQAQAICASATPRDGSPQCREALDVVFR